MKICFRSLTSGKKIEVKDDGWDTAKQNVEA